MVRRRNRMNSDIQTIGVLSEDDPADCCPSACSGDEFADTVFVTVIALGVAEIVTTVLTVDVLVSDFVLVMVVVTDELLTMSEKTVGVKFITCT